MGGLRQRIAPEHQEFRNWLNTLTPEQRKIRDSYFNFKGSKQFFLRKNPEAKDLIRERPNTPFFIYGQRTPSAEQLAADKERIKREAPQSQEFKVAQGMAQQTPIFALPQAQQPQGQQQQVQSVTGMTGGYSAQQTKPEAAQQMMGAPATGAMAQQVANQGIGGMQQPVNQFKLPSAAGLVFGGS